jgi:hypothetical protein
MQYQPDRSNYGPFNILLFAGAEGTKLITFPYAAVKGSQLLAVVTDNTSRTSPQSATSDYAQFFAIAEVSIWGLVPGYSCMLHRQATRQLTGPMNYQIPSDLPWNDIEVRARNMSGGRRGTSPTEGVMLPAQNPPPGQPTSPIYMATGFKIEVSVLLQRTRD